MSLRPAFGCLAFGLAAAVLGSGCGPVEGPQVASDADESALTAANEDFSGQLAELAIRKRRCDVEGTCPRSGDLSINSIRPLAGVQAPPLGEEKPVTAFTLCESIGFLAALESPYFFVGASAKSAAIRTLDAGGADLVFDLHNKQVAIFRYAQQGLVNLVGAEASAYAGYGFGKKDNVLDAWSGDFQGAHAAVETPFLKLAAGGAIFRAPDNSLWGALLEASFGFNMMPATVEVGASEGNWTPWDNATVALGKTFWFVEYTEAKTQAVGHKHTYLQFQSAKETALALLETLGPAGALPAVQAIALEALRKKGLSIGTACPSSVPSP